MIRRRVSEADRPRRAASRCGDPCYPTLTLVEPAVAVAPASTPRRTAVQIGPATPMLENIPIKEASALLEGEHYLGPLEFNPPYRLSTPERDALAVFATPTAYMFHRRLPGCLELTRLWQSQARREARTTKGPLSDFVRGACQWLRERDSTIPCIFSYTDPARVWNGKPHNGTVYQWAGFHKLGNSRVTDIWEDGLGNRLSAPVCYRIYRTKSREYLSGTEIFPGNFGSKKTGPKWFPVEGPGLTLIEKPAKILYCYPLTLTITQIREKLGGRYA